MKKNVLLLLVIAVVSFSCTKENHGDLVASEGYNHASTTENVSHQLAASDHDVVALKRVEECTATDYPCSNVSTILEDMFGKFDSGAFNWGLGTTGILDDLLNCPRVAIELCNRECASITMNLDNYMYEALVFDNCNDGDDEAYTAAEQWSLVNHLKALAVTAAPMCGNRKMIPVSYDIYVRYTSYASVHVEVTYVAPCSYELTEG